MATRWKNLLTRLAQDERGLNLINVPDPPSFLFLQVNKRCNLRCQHCTFWTRNDSDRSNYLPWVRKAEIMREFAQMSPDGVIVICGGESMLDLEDYFAITIECKRLGLRCMSVINGTRVKTPEMAERMMLEGPTEISVSLNSHVEAVHDRTRGVAGAFQKAVTAVRLLVEARKRHPERDTKIYVMGLIFDENYRDLDSFYDFVLNDLKADKLKLNFLQPSFGDPDPVDAFFKDHYSLDPDLLVKTIRQCDEKYRLNLNPAFIQQVGMYFRSLNSIPDVHLGWGSQTGTREHICNTYERNIMVDHYGVARLCFSSRFPGVTLKASGDLRRFWYSANRIRCQMKKCNAFCGISHSVRRETSTLHPSRPKRRYKTSLSGPNLPGRLVQLKDFFQPSLRSSSQV
jgi:MoaA/NifB/PqqE/SkfB family radical SAM enzyme